MNKLPVFASCQTGSFGRRALELIRVFQDTDKNKVLWTVDRKNGVLDVLSFHRKWIKETGYWTY